MIKKRCYCILFKQIQIRPNQLSHVFLSFPVPLPVIREPTDYIPNSVDTSRNTSREVTQNFTDTEEYEEFTTPCTERRPKVVSLFCRVHEGQMAAAPYSIKPEQMVKVSDSLFKVILCTYLILKKMNELITDS